MSIAPAIACIIARPIFGLAVPSFVEQRWKSAGRTNTSFFLSFYCLLSDTKFSVKTMNTSLFVLLLQLYVAAASTTDLTGNHATHSATKEFQEFCASKAAQLYEFYIETFQMSENWIDLLLLLFVSLCLLYVCARFHRSYSLVLYLKWIALQFIIANVWSSVVVNQTSLPLLNLFVFVCLLIWIFTAVNNDKLPNDSIEQSDRIEHGWYSKVSLLLSVAIVGLFLHY